MANNETQFKRDNKPAACTMAPWANLIPFKLRADVLLKIKQESLDAYGYDLTECPNRKVCIGTECMGRPLPYESKTAKPYLKQLEKTQKVKDGKLYINSDCSACPIFNKCKSPCHQVNDFINRSTVREPVMMNYTGIENIRQDSVSNTITTIPFPKDLEIPWDCLTKRRKKVIETYLYKQRDFLHTARLHGLNNQASAKYEFYAALTKLSEVAIMRKFLENTRNKLNSKQLFVLEEAYIKNKSFVAIAKKMKISPQAVQQIVSRLIKHYNLSWTVFVRRYKGKLIYNVPEILK